MIALTFTYLYKGDVFVASVVTDGQTAYVEEILDEDGNVPDELDWSIIEELEDFAICLWMDEQSTHYLSAEVH